MKRILIALVLFAGAILILRRLAGLLAPRISGRNARRRQSGSSGTTPAAAGAIPLVRDKVCNTFLPKNRALELSVRDEVLYFCSDDCRRRYLSDGSRGIDAA